MTGAWDDPAVRAAVRETIYNPPSAEYTAANVPGSVASVVELRCSRCTLGVGQHQPDTVEHPVVLDEGDLAAVDAGLAALDGIRLLAQSAAQNLTGADLWYWSCEFCGATPGVPCRTATGRVLPWLYSHKDRRDQCGRWNRHHIG